MNRTEKEQVIGELHDKMARAKTAIVAEPKGLTVEVVTGLRKKLRDAKIDYRIVKNTCVTALRKRQRRQQKTKSPGSRRTIKSRYRI